MTAAAVTAASPYTTRMWHYLQERFPPFAYGLLIVTYYSSNQFLAQVLTHPGEPVRYSLVTVLGAIALLCLFFHLRLFDEHKDYEDDCRYFPERVLQRGIVTLRELRGLGAAALALELTTAGCRGVATLTVMALTIIYSVLMLKEFFVRDWLKRHFLVYTGSHMLIMPLFALVVYSFATGRWFWTAPGWFWIYAFVGFFVTLNWEVSRKIRAPEDEREGVDSYTKVFGTYGAAYLVLLIRVIDTGMVMLVGCHLGASVWFHVALVLLFVVCLAGFLQYRLRTSRQTAKRMELYAGMYIIAFDLILAVELGRKLGVHFSLGPT